MDIFTRWQVIDFDNDGDDDVIVFATQTAGTPNQSFMTKAEIMVLF